VTGLGGGKHQGQLEAVEPQRTETAGTQPAGQMSKLGNSSGLRREKIYWTDIGDVEYDDGSTALCYVVGV